jgi:Flp pilus assembly protein TadD
VRACVTSARQSAYGTQRFRQSELITVDVFSDPFGMSEGPNVPSLGISLRGLNYFIHNCGGLNEISQLTTNDVCERYLKPQTRHQQLSYCEYLVSIGSHHFVGKPIVFISHAWQYKFVDVLNAISKIQFDREEENYIWIDLFSNNQHVAPSLPFEFWCHTFKSAIADFGRTVLILSPWNNPIALTRVWCLWEIYCTAITRSKFEVIMTDQEDQSFRQALIDDFGSINKMIALIDSRNSTSSNPSDREKIFQAIESTTGFDSLNAIVFEQLRIWLVSSAKRGLTIQNMSTSVRIAYVSNLARLLSSHGNFDEAEPLFKEVLSASYQSNGKMHPNTLCAVNNLAGILKKKGNLAEAEQHYRQSLSGRRITLGNNHPDSLQSMNDLGGLLAEKGNLQESELLFREALSGRQEVLGSTHADTLISMNNLSRLLAMQGRLQESELLYRETLHASRLTLGGTHPDTLRAINNLAGLLKSQGNLKESEQLYRESLSGRRSKLGDLHPDTIQSINDLAALLALKDNFNEAEHLLREALVARQHLLSASHPDTLISMNNLARLLALQGRFSESEPLYRETLEESRSQLGDTHPDTLRAINNLAGLLKKSGNLIESERLYRESLSGRRERLGDHHPDTLQSINDLAALLAHHEDNLNEAEYLFREALYGRQDILGSNHPDTIMSAYNLSRILTMIGKEAEAKYFQDRANELSQSYQS